MLPGKEIYLDHLLVSSFNFLVIETKGDTVWFLYNFRAPPTPGRPHSDLPRSCIGDVPEQTRPGAGKVNDRIFS